VTVKQSPDDGFPRDRFVALVGRFPKYARLAWRLARDDRLSRARQAALLAGAAYLVSPIDLVPGFIPVVGQLDDAVVVLLAIRHALTGLPPADREAALARAGLDPQSLDDDLRTIGATYAWLGRRGAQLTWRAGRALARAGSRLGHRLVARARREA
jgi:uncharacterized membrane protein YkvA (DUF1232 family)